MADVLDALIAEKRHGAAIVLRDVRLTALAGEFVGLSGPSGCGKTTLMNILAGIDRAFAGSLVAPQARGVVFQDPRLLPWRSVAANIALAAPGMTAAAIDAVLASVGLPGTGDLLPGQLSLGMARRVALVRALAVQPRLLLLDEPLVSLDEDSARICRRVVMEYWETYRPIVVMVSHDAADLAAMAHRVMRLG